MDSVLYVPGFRENAESQTGMTVRKYAEEVGRVFTSMVLPGHKGSEVKDYSLTLTEVEVIRAIEESLGKIKEIVAYSFSGGPVKRALTKVPNQVERLTLINPALKPLKAVVNFHNQLFVGRKGKDSKIITEEEFLASPEKVLKLITRGCVSGNIQGFVNDIVNTSITPQIIGGIGQEKKLRIIVHPEDPIIDFGNWRNFIETGEVPVEYLMQTGNDGVFGNHIPHPEELLEILRKGNSGGTKKAA